MHTDLHEKPSGPSPEALKLGYEPPQEVSLRPMVIGLFAAIIIVVAVFAASWFIEAVILKLDMSKTATTSGVQAAPVKSMIPLPPLQPSGASHPTVDRQDLAKMHADEDQIFGDLGWKTEDGNVRVPDSVLTAITKRQSGLKPGSSDAIKVTPEPAPVSAPSTTPGGTN